MAILQISVIGTGLRHAIDSAIILGECILSVARGDWEAETAAAPLL